MRDPFKKTSLCLVLLWNREIGMVNFRNPLTSDILIRKGTRLGGGSNISKHLLSRYQDADQILIRVIWSADTCWSRFPPVSRSRLAPRTRPVLPPVSINSIDLVFSSSISDQNQHVYHMNFHQHHKRNVHRQQSPRWTLSRPPLTPSPPYHQIRHFYRIIIITIINQMIIRSIFLISDTDQPCWGQAGKKIKLRDGNY